MQAVAVRFDQVLHIKRRGGWSGVASTTFSFRDGATYRPYVTVEGSPALRDGMRVLALLRKPEDWSSLVGWKDLDTGALSLITPRACRSALLRQLAVLVGVLLAWWMGLHLSLILGAVAVLAFGIWSSVRSLRQAESDLLEIELLGLAGEPQQRDA